MNKNTTKKQREGVLEKLMDTLVNKAKSMGFRLIMGLGTDEQNNKSPFKAYKLSEKSVQVGDLICYSRQPNVNYDTTSSYKSHCDIVVDVNKLKKTAEVIGGNVSDGVTKRIVNLNSQGNLTDTSQDWFTIIKNSK